MIIKDDYIRLPKHHDITVVIENGVCVDVVGLPEEWKYIVQDNDN